MSGYRLSGSYDYNVVCDSCGFQYKASQLKKRWDGLMVCEADWETRHSLDFYKTRNDTHKLPFILPDGDAMTWLELGEYATGYTSNSADPTLNTTFPIIGATPTADFITNTTTDQWTIMAWVRPEPSLVGRFAAIISTRDTALAGSCSFELSGSAATSRNGIVMFGSTAQMVRVTDQPIQYGTWQHIAFTAYPSSGPMYTYWNGNFRNFSRVTPATLVGNSDTVCIGRHQQASTVRIFHGGLRDIRFFNTSMSQQQIVQYMNDNMTMSTTATGLIGWWKLDEGSGLALADSQTNYTAMNFNINANGGTYEWKAA